MELKMNRLKKNKKNSQVKTNASSSRVEEIKNAIKNGTYQINLKGSAEKLAQELLR